MSKDVTGVQGDDLAKRLPISRSHKSAGRVALRKSRISLALDGFEVFSEHELNLRRASCLPRSQADTGLV